MKEELNNRKSGKSLVIQEDSKIDKIDIKKEAQEVNMIETDQSLLPSQIQQADFPHLPSPIEIEKYSPSKNGSKPPSKKRQDPIPLKEGQENFNEEVEHVTKKTKRDS